MSSLKSYPSLVHFLGTGFVARARFCAVALLALLWVAQPASAQTPDLSGTTTPLPVTPGGDAVVVFPDLVVSDADANPVVMRVRVENPNDLNAGDTMAFSGTPNTNGFQLQFFTGAEILGAPGNDTFFAAFASSAAGTADNWHDLLRNLTFAAPAGSGEREIRLFVQVRYTASGSDSSDTLTRTLNIGAPAANSPPTGLPTITGTPRVGVTLTANTSGISDADGPDPLPFTYQWNTHAGGTDTAINNATSATYLLTADEMGDQITVSVRYTDAGNTNEGPLTSVPTAAVAMMSPLELSGTTTPLPVTPGGAPVAIFPDLSIDTGRPNTFRLRVESAANLNSGDAVTLAAAAERRNYDISFIPIASVGASQNIIVGVSTPDNDDEAPERWHNLLRHFTFQAPAGSGGREVRFIAELTVSDLVSGNDVVRTLTRTLNIGAPAPANSPPTGLPTITGTPRVGETLTAETGAIADANGLANATFTYQWLGNDGNLSGQTLQTLALTSLNLGTDISVRVRFTDDDGFNETLTSTEVTVEAATTNSPPTGRPTVAGLFAQEQELTADTVNVADADGLPAASTFQYQWHTNDGTGSESGTNTPITGATMRTYTLTEDEVGLRIGVTVRYTDLGTPPTDESVTNTFLPLVTGPAAPLVADAGADQVVNEGALVTLDASGSSSDAPGPLFYVWGQDDNSGHEILLVNPFAAQQAFPAPSGLSEDAELIFLLGVSDTSGEIATDEVRVRVRAAASAANNPPTGRLTIDGDPRSGQTLTANTSDIGDADGLPATGTAGAFTYQWFAEDDTTNAEIAGATDPSYLLTDAQIDARISLVLRYTDGLGVAERVTSLAVGPVVPVNSAPVAVIAPIDPALLLTEGDLTGLDGGISTTLDGSGSSDPDGDELTYLWSFSSAVTATPGGTVPDNSIATPVLTISQRQSFADILTISLTVTDPDGLEDTATVEYVLLPETPIPNRHPNADPQPSTQTVFSGDTVTLDGSNSSDPDLGQTATLIYRWRHIQNSFFGEIPLDGAGTPIASFTAPPSTSDTNINTTNGFELTVTDTAGASDTREVLVNIRPNSPPTGAVRITGIPLLGVTLTANTDTLRDPDGLPAASTFAYQWQRNGVDIAGATERSYLLTADDAGELITVTVSYEDEATGPNRTNGKNESLTSDPVGPVSGVPPVVITGTPTQGEVLTADTSGIDDNPQPGSVFAYQWLANDGTTNAEIAGATNRNYLLRQAEVGQRITLRVNYTNANGAETGPLTSAPTAAVADANVGPSGVVRIDGRPTQGGTLTADTSAITDGDGPDTLQFTYQWNTHESGANTPISGETSATYLLSADDLGEQITVSVRYTDAEGNAEGPLTSAPTAAVSGLGLSGATTPLSVTPGGAPVAIFPDLRIDRGRPSTFRLRVESTADLNPGDTVALAADAERSSYTIVFVPIANIAGPLNTIVGVDTPDNDDEAPERWHNLLRHFTFQAPAGSGGREVRFIAELTIPDLVSGTNDVVETLTRTLNIGANNRPTSSGLSATLDEDDSHTFAADQFGFDDTDSGDTLQAVRIDTLPDSADGSLALDGTAVTAEQVIPVADIPNLVYTPATNVNGQATFTFSVSDGTDFSDDVATASLTVDAVNDPPSGTVTIAGTPVRGQNLTANTFAIEDVEGPNVLPFTYQWNRDDGTTTEAISGATSVIYTLTEDDVGAQITVSVEYTDAEGTAEGPLTSAPTAAVTAASTPNNPPTGLPIISGTATEGETLTADTSGISDADGPDPLSFTYQWNRRDGTTDTAISGATSATYILTQGDVGEMITLTVSYTDGGSTDESLTSAPTAAVANVNDEPTGLPIISGTATEGETLTADTSGITDADGPDPLPFTYQWNRNDGTTDTAISGATSASYILTQGDVGEMITLTVSYTDGGSTDESLTSAPTAAVANVNDEPTGLPIISGTATEGQTLTADTSGITDADGPDPLPFTYQWNRRDGTTDTAISGATSASYILTQGDVGEMITLTVSYTDGGSTDESLTSAPTAAVANVNDEPTGLPIISGTATEGETLTADTSGITDADGPDPLSFTYQWNRNDGTTDTAISGATSASYILTQGDVGEMITLTVSYTDGGSTDESLTSAPTAAVTAASTPNNPPTGLPIISGTATEGETLTADTSGISDADGPDPLPFTYQWNRRDGTTDTAISGATSASYILTQGDVGEMITLTVSYTDGGSTDESLTSAPTAAVANVNDEPTGLPIISGTATEGETLTADTSGITDADGPDPLSFTYQWNRNDGTTDTAISGATSATYTLTQGDVGEMITLTVSYTDGGSTDESLTSAPTAAVTAASTPNNPPTGLPIISGTATEGETLTADTSGITDADGPDPLSFTYQWNRNDGTTDTAISGATSASYILTQGDVGEMITLTVSYTDGGSTDESLTSAPTAAVGNVNDEPTGLPIISGTATEGETLTADTSGITDADGPDPLSFTYQWNRNDGTTDTAISGATSATYTLTQGDVGEMITLTVSYTDGGSTDESLTSAPTAAVGNVNDEPTGLPIISGTATEGETLTADTSGITDADGPDPLSFTYQWNRNDGTTDTAISGATSATYTLTQGDVGEMITLTVSYTDGGSTDESLTSAPTAAVGNVNDEPTGLPIISGTATEGETLTADTSGITDADGPDPLSFTYQWNRNDGTTDTAISGATSATYTLTQGDVGEMITLTVSYTDGGSTDESLTSAPTAAVGNVNDEPTGLPIISGTATEGETLTADTSGITDADGPDPLSFTYQWNRNDGTTDTAISGATSATYTLTQGDVGEMITLTVSYTDGGSTDESLTSAPTAAVAAASTPNNPPTGLPIISGTATEGETLTADTSGITDADGPDPLSFTYQWNRNDGTTDTAISGATSASYILTQGDVGEMITLTVSYTDGGSTDESLTSAPTAAVGNVNDEPTGLPIISGTATEGETLTADTSGITDADGPDPLSFTYQWNRNDGTTDTAISGATSATYTLTQGDVGEMITLTVSYTDGGSTDESLTSAPTAAVGNVNDEPTGLPIISGTATEGETLTADTSGITDADGPDPLSFTYQWNRNDGTTDTAISGATSATYTLTQGDVGEMITLTVSYTDGGSTDESLTSAPTAAVAAASTPNNPPTGLPIISGTATEGETLTADTSGITDADGPDPLSFTYQWNRNDGTTDTAISGATSATYILTQGDVGEMITLTVSYTDGGSTDESLTSAPTAAVANVNDEPTGLPIISGTATEGETLTADTSGITDADGPDPLSFTYQWNRNDGTTDTAISGATSATYTLTQGDVGEMITLTVSYTDGGSTDESLTSAPTAAVTAASTPNNPPTGLPIISGTATEGETLTADTSGITDADGPDPLSFTYQWNRNDGTTDTAISGATSASYILTQGDVGEMITLTVSYTDGGSTDESLTSAPTAAVGNVNDEPTGLPIISGTATEGETLTADTSGITDADGPDPLSFTYQWNRNDGTTDTAISGATSATYTLTQGDVGEMITLTVSYTDGGSTDESLTSAPTAAVGNVNDEPTGLPIISGTATEGETLTADTSGITDADGPDPLSFTYQWNRNDGTTDTAISGATSATYTLTQGDVGEMITLTVSYTDGGSTDESLTSAPTAAVAAASTPNNPPTGLPIISGTATEGETLTADTSGITDADGPDPLSFTYQWNRNDGTTDTAISGATSASYILTQGDVGEMITLTVSYTDGGSTDESLTSAPTAAVAAASTPNNPPTGLPIISGTATEGETLTADTSGITDADGPDPLSFTYQWNRNDGTTDTAISGATSATYILTQGDVGEMITLTVSYTDGGSTDESLTSAPTAAVAAASTPNNPPTGLPIISGTATEGETLTADTSGITDADGPDPLSFTYQWNRNDGTTDTPISGATSASYTLTQGDVGEMITLTVSYTDGGSTDESLTSAPTAAVAAISTNNPPTTTGLTVSTNEDTAYPFTAANFNFTDADMSDMLEQVRIDTLPASTSGSLTLGGAVVNVAQVIAVANIPTLVYIPVTNVNGDATFTFSVSDGTDFSTTPATATITVNAVNDDPSGTVTISGTPQVGQTLTADTSGITDADGPDPLTFTYQWNTHASGANTAIDNATSATYTPVAGNVGDQITVSVRYTDAGNEDEGPLTSAPTAVIQTNTRPTASASVDQGVADKGSLITLNGSGSNDPDGDNANLTYQWTQQPGSVTVTLSDPTAQQPTFTIPTLIESGFTFVFRLVVSDGALSSTNTAEVTVRTRPIFQFPTTLDDQTYVVGNQIDDLTLPTALDIFGNPNTYTLSPLPPGLSFNTTNRTLSGTPTQAGTFDLIYVATSSLGTDSRSFSIAVINLPTITGTPTEGEELTADASAIIAANGLDESDISYQWQADGVDIANATSITYTLSTDDIGKRITVTASFTVGATSEERTSAPTALVAVAGNIPATGEPTISGILQVGQTLTADTSAITDANGPAVPAFSYQWQADGQDIAGATAITYIPTADDVGDMITVTAIFTDDGGTREERTSAPTAVIETNTRPTANAGSGSTADKGSLITLNGSGSNDPDGDNANLTYLWMQTRGTPVTLSDPAAQQPTFNIPTIIDPEFTFVFSLVVSDGALSSTNRAEVTIFTRPIFPFPTTLVDQTYVVGNQIDDLILPTALDIPGNPNTYTLSPLPPGLSFNTTNRTLSGTPTQAGTFDLTYVATNGDNDTDSRSFSIAVVDPVTVSIAPPGAAVDEGDPATFAVTLSGSPTDEVVVNYATAVGTATQGDFTETSGTLTFAANATDLSQDISVPTTDDSETEGVETFTATLSANPNSPLPAGVTLDTTSAQATIAASDAPVNSPPTTSGLAVTTNEDTDYTFASADFPFTDTDMDDSLAEVRIDTLPDSANGSLALNGTAVTAMDVIAVADIPTLVYTPVTNVNGDATFTFSVSDGTAFSTPPATATITVNAVNDDPSGTVTISGTPQVGQTLMANTAGISDADGPATLSFTYQWLAGSTLISNSDSPTYLLTGDELGAMISVDVSYMDADGFEGGVVSDPVGPVIAAGTVTVSIAPPGAAVDEGDPATFTVTLSDSPTDEVVVNYATSIAMDDTAAAADFTETSGTLTFAANASGAALSQTFPVPVTDDSLTEGLETFTATLSANTASPLPAGVTLNPSATSAQATIAASDAPVNTPPTTSGLAVTTNEDTDHTFAAANFNFTDTDSGDMLEQVRIDSLPVSASGSLALNGTPVIAGQVIAVADIPTLVYTPVANVNGAATFTFSVSDGDDFSATATATVTVNSVNDDPSGTVTISGTPQVGQTLMANTAGISDADGPATLSFTYQWLAGSTLISNSDSPTYLLTGDELGAMISVDVSYMDADGFEGGVVSDPVGPVIAAGTVTVSIVPPGAAVDEGDPATFTVTLSGSPTDEVVVNYATSLASGDTALAADFTETSGTLTFAAGATSDGLSQTFSVPTTDDSDTEEVETFTLTLSAPGGGFPTGVTLNPSATSAQATIAASDAPVNNPPTGLPTIDGMTIAGQTLTADTSGITDADGPDPLPFTYQWLANDGTTNEEINGATSPTYLLTGNELGEMITVSVRYTDAGNTAEGPLTSDPVGPVVAAQLEVLDEEEEAEALGVALASTDSAGTTITLPTSEPVDVSNASTADFMVTSTLNGATTTHEVTAIDAGSIILTVSPAIPAGADIVVFYAPVQGSITGTITSTRLAEFSGNLSVINNVVNRAPTADAGDNQTVAEGATVTLNGSASSDSEGEDLTYAWTQSSGTNVTLNDASAESPTFTAPANLSANAVLEFTLTVNDGTSDSTPDPVRISVTTDAPARQQALKTGLAALGRGLAASATDAIGQRLKPAATGPETSSFSGLSLANCIANITGLTPTDTASADGADRSAWFDPRNLGGDIGSAEPDNNSRNNSRNPLGACRLPDSGQLARSAFVIPLNRLSGKGNTGAGGGIWSLWGRGDLSRFEGRPQTGLDLDGDLRAGYLGLDYRLSSGGLVGVALSRSEGEIDIGTTDGALDNGTFDEGTLDTSLNSVYPYGYWSPRAGMGLWGLLGVGSGDATLSHRETDFATDLDMRMGALGLRQVVQTLGSFELALKADAFVVELESEDVPGLPAVSARARRARLLLEASHSWQLQPDERLGTSLELGARADGGDADEGAGAELGVGLEYSNTRLGLRAQWRAQGLLAHSASGFEEWGTSLNVELDPGVSGRGLALTLAPTWGQAASGGAQALWQSDRPLRDSGLAPASAMRMNLDLSYGLNRDRRQLSPFASLGLADGVMQRLRLGLRLRLADELEMELFGGRNASENRSPEHLLGLTGRLRF